MAESKYITAPIPSKKMPAGIPYILSNEAFERFSFYGMKCILAVFMTQYLLNQVGELDPMTEDQAKFWVHLFVSAVYFLGVIGALISDIWLSKFRTIIFFSIVYCLGFLTISWDITRVGLFATLALVAIGSGIIKPCVSANVGDQFGSRNKHLIAQVYNWFYFAINLGAFISNLLIPKLLRHFGANVAFSVPGIFMCIATLTYWLGRKKFVHIPAGGKKFIKETVSREGLKALGKLCIIFVFIAPFWALFDQMDSSWVLLLEKMNRTVDLGFWSFEVESSQVVASNPLLIMILIPIFSFVVYPVIDRYFKLTALRKMSIGLFVAASVFVIPALVARYIAAGHTLHFAWMLLAYVLLTSAEVMVSITCLEFSYTQAPKTMKSFISSAFLLSISLGNAFTALVNWFIQNPDGTSKLAGASYFWFFVIVMVITAVLFIFVAAKYREKSYIQDENTEEVSS